MTIHRIWAPAFSGLLAWGMAGAQTYATRPVTLDIEAQPVSAALQEFGEQAGLQVLMRLSGDAADDVTIAAVKGEFTIKEGLERVLAQTKLEYEFINERTVRVAKHGVTDSARNAKEDARPLELARAESESPRTAPASDQESSVLRSGASLENVIELEEIIVTGTHIRGAQPTGSRVVVIDREQIERSGYGRIEDVIAQEPAAFNGNNELTPLAASANVNSANAMMGNEVQLRGLGPGTTLTLLNGVRMPAGGAYGAMVDISMIPAVALERVEMMTDGASAIYGSDAIGGVVNFILRGDYEGLETRVRVAGGDGGPYEKQFAQVFGTSWDSGNVILGYQFNERGELEAADRLRSALGLDYTSLGGQNFQVRPYAGSPGTIVTAAGLPTHAIPAGQDGTDLDASDLTAGFNRADYVSNTWILPRQELHSVFFGLSQHVGEKVELFAHGLYSERTFTQMEGSYKNTVLVPAANPFYVNPLGGSGPVRVSYDFGNDLGPMTRQGEVRSYLGILGARIGLAADWRLNATLSGGAQDGKSSRQNSALIARINAALALTDPATALNVFGSGGNNNPATLATLRSISEQTGETEAYSAGLIADGPVFAMPAGMARLALGADFRAERLEATSTVLVTHARDDRDVSAAFGELLLPIVAGDAGRDPRLQVSLATRYERYSDFGETTNPKLGVTWNVMDGIRMRGTWGSSFHAPGFGQTNTAISPVSGFVNVLNDPRVGGTSRVLVLGGNNPDLQPETADVWSAGIDIEPFSERDIELSFTYFDIAYRDKVGVLTNGSTVLQREAEWQSIITRNPTPAQISAVCDLPTFNGDCTGTFAAIIDGRQRNLAVVDVSGIDASLSAAMDTGVGRFTGSVRGTYFLSYEQAVTADAALVDNVDTVGYPLDLRLVASLGWSHAGWSAGAVVQYVGSYRNPGVTPDTVGSFTTANLNLGYRWEGTGSWADGTRVTLAATNVFDEEPPFVNLSAGYDAANAVILGRSLSLTVVREW